MKSESIYERVTEKLLTKLREGVVPWRASWTGTPIPVNGISKKPYRGINSLLLALEGYNSPTWMTFKQVSAKGGRVKRGEKATAIIFWRWIEKEEEEKKKRIPILKQYNVFNALQCEGLADDDSGSKITRRGIEGCDGLIKTYFLRENDLKLEEYKVHPFYLPERDIVNMPPIENFDSKEDYYSTFFHELVHSTGHKSRLDRGLLKTSAYGSESYSKEELIAELGACFLCAQVGIENRVIDSAASYIDGWIKVLEADSRLVVQAGSKAQQAADYIRAVPTFSEVISPQNIPGN